jgi:hypothetical protein
MSHIDLTHELPSSDDRDEAIDALFEQFVGGGAACFEPVRRPASRHWSLELAAD